jgi:hypothetical protein
MCESSHDCVCKRQKEGIIRDVVVLYPPSEALDDAFVLARTEGCVLDAFGELDLTAANDSTNQERKRDDVALLMALATHTNCLQQGLFYGTIRPEAGAHGLLLCQTLAGLT